VATMDIDSLLEDSNIPLASDDSSFSAGELCGREIVSDKSANFSDFDNCGFGTSEAIKTRADFVPESSIAGPDQEIPFCVYQQLVSEVDSVVADASNRLDCSIPGTSGGDVSLLVLDLTFYIAYGVRATISTRDKQHHLLAYRASPNLDLYIPPLELCVEYYL